MRIHCLQHVAFEDAANIGRWAEDQGHRMTYTRLDEGRPLPGMDTFDWLVVMGGPMNIYEHDAYPWLVEEKVFLREAIRYGRTLLGVCLGAQLAADALGGPVTRNPQKEIGWFPVELTQAARESVLFRDFPERFLPFHWHGDTFALPPGAVHIAQSTACSHQAFQHGKVVGLQFHLDYSAQSVERMVRHCGDELRPAPTIQRPEEMLADRQRFEETRLLLYRLLDAMERQFGAS